jgi:hypothetical protein
VDDAVIAAGERGLAWGIPLTGYNSGIAAVREMVFLHQSDPSWKKVD